MQIFAACIVLKLESKALRDLCQTTESDAAYDHCAKKPVTTMLTYPYVYRLIVNLVGCLQQSFIFV